jgi:predicted RNase H-like HicB family nuclease
MNKKDLFIYPAIITNEDNKYWVEFIDLKGCYSQGDTLLETMENAKEAMGLYLEDIDEYPQCTENIKNIKIEDNQVISFITV